MFVNISPWPATTRTLEEWSAQRIYGSTLTKQGRIKPETLITYLSSLRSYHIDHNLPTDPFEAPCLARIIKGGKRIFSRAKAERLPITKNIFSQITSFIPSSTEDHSIDAAFKVAWAGFLRLGEITYTHAERNKSSFASTSTTRSDVFFSENDQYAILRLKRSKTDINHTGVQIVLAATGEPTCPVASLRRLFLVDPQLPSAPLFQLASGSFPRQRVITILRSRLIQAGLSDTGFSGHSFRKGAAQHASDHGMLEENIQKLGRWSSDAFQHYFKDSSATLFHLNLSFQKGVPLAIPRASLHE